jgi:hypothetical protein
VREDVREDVVMDYARTYKEKKIKLPPVVVFTADNQLYYLADGTHRINALLTLKQKTVVAEIHKGTYADALTYALKANAHHGLRRTHADKRRSVAEAIKQWPKLTNNQLAELCLVDNHTIKAIRDEMENAGKVKPEPVREGKDGRKIAAPRLPRKEEPEGGLVGNSQQAEAKVVDRIGTVIPDFALLFWNRTEEVKALVSHLSEVGRALKAAQKSEDLMYGELNFSSAIADLDRAHTNVAQAIPYAVCSQCQGHPKTQPKGECRLCKGRGLVSKFRWDQLVPAEIKAMLIKRGKE